MKFLKIAGIAVILAASITACGDGRDCVRSEIQLMPVPQYNAATKTTTIQMMYIPQCVEYADESV